jgi:hypothetical protein
MCGADEGPCLLGTTTEGRIREEELTWHGQYLLRCVFAEDGAQQHLRQVCVAGVGVPLPAQHSTAQCVE